MSTRNLKNKLNNIKVLIHNLKAIMAISKGHKGNP